MSATFHLYKVLDDVNFLGSKYDLATKEERQIVENAEPDDVLWDDFYTEKFSDGKKHDILDLTYYKALSKQYKPNRLYKQIKPLYNLPRTDLPTTWGWNYKAIVVDSVLYRQGWFLTREFFNKKLTLFITNDKDKMIKFLKRYLDFSYRYKGNNEYFPAKECLESFSNAFCDGMIFMCSF